MIPLFGTHGSLGTVTNEKPHMAVSIVFLKAFLKGGALTIFPSKRHFLRKMGKW